MGASNFEKGIVKTGKGVGKIARQGGSMSKSARRKRGKGLSGVVSGVKQIGSSSSGKAVAKKTKTFLGFR
jgi:hypothetical protein